MQFIPQENNVVTIYRWDFFVLSLTALEIEQIQSEITPEGRLSAIKNLSLVCQEFGSALRHFDYDLGGTRNAAGICDISSEGITLQHLIQRWNESNGTQMPEALVWADELAVSIDKAISRRASEPTRHLMKSLFRQTNGWLHLHLNVVRKMADDSREFEIYMYRLKDNLPWLRCDVLE